MNPSTQLTDGSWLNDGRRLFDLTRLNQVVAGVRKDLKKSALKYKHMYTWPKAKAKLYDVSY